VALPGAPPHGARRHDPWRTRTSRVAAPDDLMVSALACGMTRVASSSVATVAPRSSPDGRQRSPHELSTRRRQHGGLATSSRASAGSRAVRLLLDSSSPPDWRRRLDARHTWCLARSSATAACTTAAPSLHPRRRSSSYFASALPPLQRRRAPEALTRLPPLGVTSTPSRCDSPRPLDGLVRSSSLSSPRDSGGRTVRVPHSLPCTFFFPCISPAARRERCLTMSSSAPDVEPVMPCSAWPATSPTGSRGTRMCYCPRTRGPLERNFMTVRRSRARSRRLAFCCSSLGLHRRVTRRHARGPGQHRYRTSNFTTA